jgi:hypothetical protein
MLNICIMNATRHPIHASIWLPMQMHHRATYLINIVVHVPGTFISTSSALDILGCNGTPAPHVA